MQRRPNSQPPKHHDSGRTTYRSSRRRTFRRGTRGIRSSVSGRRRLRSVRSAKAAGERSLSGFRQATVLAVAITSLLVFFVPESGAEPPQEATEQTVVDTTAAETLPEAASTEGERPELRADSLALETTTRAREAFEDILTVFIRGLPKLIVALLILIVAWLVVRFLRPLVRRVLGGWERAAAVSALFGIGVWLIAVSLAVGVLAGDFRALLGSLGLVGLALSWALQTPIESFTGWLLNSFQGYYRVGDRIAVGDVFGDVYRIDFLTTTVWEYGGPDRPPSFIRAEQATGRLITFPNNEVLTGSIVNYTRDFDYVWDELSVSIAPESDLAYAAGIDPRREQLVLTLALAVVVAVAIKVVGVLLIAAMLIIPAAAARPLAATPERMAVIAAVIAAASALGGLRASFQLDTPTGPSIVCTAALIFAATTTVCGLWRRRRAAAVS